MKRSAGGNSSLNSMGLKVGKLKKKLKYKIHPELGTFESTD